MNFLLYFFYCFWCKLKELRIQIGKIVAVLYNDSKTNLVRLKWLKYKELENVAFV